MSIANASHEMQHSGVSGKAANTTTIVQLVGGTEGMIIGKSTFSVLTDIPTTSGVFAPGCMIICVSSALGAAALSMHIVFNTGSNSSPSWLGYIS